MHSHKCSQVLQDLFSGHNVAEGAPVHSWDGSKAAACSSLDWIYVKFYVEGYRDTEVTEGNRCICVVAVEGTRMLDLNMKDSDRKLEFPLYFHFQEKHTKLKLFLKDWKQNFLSLNLNQITSQ